jgi:hypothetical protein
LSANSTANRKEIYLKKVKTFWKFGTSKEVTEEMLNSEVLFYTDTVAGGTTAIITDIMINIGETALPFEPYKEPQTLSIPYVLREGDKISYAEGKLKTKTKRYVFDGTESWRLGYGNGDGVNNRFEITLSDSNIAVDSAVAYRALSNAFSYEKYEGIPSVNCFRIAISEIGEFPLFNPSTDTIPLDDLDAWKSKLAEMYANGNPLYIEYELANPIETDLTDEDIAQYEALRMNYPNTTIVSDAFTEVEYVADTKCYIDKKFKELQDNLISATAQLL